MQYSEQLARFEDEQSAKGDVVEPANFFPRFAVQPIMEGRIEMPHDDDLATGDSSESLSSLPAVGVSSRRPMSHFARAMERERNQITRILPSGKGQKRLLGAEIIPKQQTDRSDTR